MIVKVFLTKVLLHSPYRSHVVGALSVPCVALGVGRCGQEPEEEQDRAQERDGGIPNCHLSLSADLGQLRKKGVAETLFIAVYNPAPPPPRG